MRRCDSPYIRVKVHTVHAKCGHLSVLGRFSGTGTTNNKEKSMSSSSDLPNHAMVRKTLFILPQVSFLEVALSAWWRHGGIGPQDHACNQASNKEMSL